MDNYSVLTTVMEEFSEESHDEPGRKAAGILAMLEKFSTYFGLRLAGNDRIRNLTVCEESTDLTEWPQLPRQQRLPKKFGGDTQHLFDSASQYFRKEYFDVLDIIVNELDRRFDQHDFGVVEDIERLLVTAGNGDEVTVPSSMKSLYTDFDYDQLCAQLHMLPDTIKTSTLQHHKLSVRVISNAMNAVPVVKDLLFEVHELLKLFFTIPVSTASAERSFSTLRRLKSYLRSTMTQKRLNDLMNCHIHRDILEETDMTAIAKEYVQANDRRRQAFGKF
ncbi:hypothetical protein ACEWY4_003814 [Coilia grayii]|uniref:HAT C-terminal dimerisation domain-containing protein n=1 Tax=Coilia grayii TaxID=363190 RepID=A0ABD1KSF0_9TELE